MGQNTHLNSSWQIKTRLAWAKLLLYYPIYFIFSTDYRIITSIRYFIDLVLVIIAALNSSSLWHVIDKRNLACLLACFTSVRKRNENFYKTGIILRKRCV